MCHFGGDVTKITGRGNATSVIFPARAYQDHIQPCSSSGSFCSLGFSLSPESLLPLVHRGSCTSDTKQSLNVDWNVPSFLYSGAYELLIPPAWFLPVPPSICLCFSLDKILSHPRQPLCVVINPINKLFPWSSSACGIPVASNRERKSLPSLCSDHSSCFL